MPVAGGATPRTAAAMSAGVAGSRLQVVEPGGVGRVPGPERPAHQGGVARLEHPQLEVGPLGRLLDAVDHDLAGRRRHDRAAHRTGEPGQRAVRLGEDLHRPGQRHLEVVVRPGVTLDEQVVRHRAGRQLGPPQRAPDPGVVVDVRDQRRLAVDDGAGGPDPGQRPSREVGLQLARMAEVGHHGELPPRGHDLLEQPQHVVGVRVGDEPLRPVGDRLGADPDRPHRVDAEQRLQMAAQPLGGHHHRVAAGDQHVVTSGCPAR